MREGMRLRHPRASLSQAQASIDAEGRPVIRKFGWGGARPNSGPKKKKLGTSPSSPSQQQQGGAGPGAGPAAAGKASAEVAFAAQAAAAAPEKSTAEGRSDWGGARQKAAHLSRARKADEFLSEEQQGGLSLAQGAAGGGSGLDLLTSVANAADSPSRGPGTQPPGLPPPPPPPAVQQLLGSFSPALLAGGGGGASTQELISRLIASLGSPASSAAGARPPPLPPQPDGGDAAGGLAGVTSALLSALQGAHRGFGLTAGQQAGLLATPNPLAALANVRRGRDGWGRKQWILRRIARRRGFLPILPPPLPFPLPFSMVAGAGVGSHCAPGSSVHAGGAVARACGSAAAAGQLGRGHQAPA